LADRLNRECLCADAEASALRSALAADVADAAEEIWGARPHLFSTTAAFIARADIDAMLALIQAVEAAARMPLYEEQALARAAEIAQEDHGPIGALMGYDFHLTTAGPRLIEINTNAGGAFICAAIARERQACVGEAVAPAADFDDSVLAMFRSEWRRQRGDASLFRIAIVDDGPGEQYLYPEFLAARRLFERSGHEAVIADAKELSYQRGALRFDSEPIDLVYNRLTDFSLADPAHRALGDAYRDGAVVVTPNPRNHALFADKRNLVVLSDLEAMRKIGLSELHIAALRAVAPASIVNETNAPALWADRDARFFKPACGFASKAVYRGDKMTKSVWARVVSGDYVAQEFAPPSERIVLVNGAPARRKFDVRIYAYNGRPLLAAARLYQGQTTNFRTPGGGFAPLFVI
ncbi:MAG: hypothetical protein ACOZAA_16395, partial [Pseudomonadota bacterium]